MLVMEAFVKSRQARWCLMRRNLRKYWLNHFDCRLDSADQAVRSNETILTDSYSTSAVAFETELSAPKNPHITGVICSAVLEEYVSLRPISLSLFQDARRVKKQYFICLFCYLPIFLVVVT